MFTDTFEERHTRHRYRVIRLWEQDAKALLANSALLPLATLAQTNSPNTLLEEIASRVAIIEEPDQRK